ncbi:uncharacterized protein si:ch211-67e16.4 isoform X2 [Pangasianodon hypophthalmus]|uniref:uncharacterized protein si:ch211-67e16.4 isoform X2 n=1 Tax=Pangasianodon hypophthalmus TaxID=310915 RepID=UPI00230793CA|nr:uncharacterized protein si:ch211-67e16.4 isoform X2 [Pangasianodon hypophthalmus]XP_034160729.2 uncharacterized protein si:ch211-67e16.4 isoform X2 [Pangasianodon hypophthalmus]
MDVNLTISLMRGQMGVVIEKAVNAAVETVLGEMIRVMSLKFEQLRREMTAKEKENEDIRKMLESTRCQMKILRQKYVNALNTKDDRHAFAPHRHTLGLMNAARNTAAQLDSTRHPAGQLDSTRHPAGQLDSTRHPAGQLDASRHAAAQLDSTRHPAGQLDSTRHPAGQLDASRHAAAQLDSTRHAAAQLDASRHAAAQLDASRHAAAQLDSTRHAAGQLDASRHAAGQMDSTRHAAGQLDATRHAAGQLDATRHAAGQLDATRHAAGQLDSTRHAAGQLDSTRAHQITSDHGVPPRRRSSNAGSPCAEPLTLALKPRNPEPAHAALPALKTHKVILEAVPTESSQNAETYNEEEPGLKVHLGLKVENSSSIVPESIDPLWGQTPQTSTEAEHTEIADTNLLPVAHTSEALNSAMADCQEPGLKIKQEEAEVEIVEVKEEQAEPSTSELPRIELHQHLAGAGMAIEMPVTQQCIQIPSVTEPAFMGVDPSACLHVNQTFMELRIRRTDRQSSMEKSRRYREKLNADPVKKEAMLEARRRRYQERKARGEIKSSKLLPMEKRIKLQQRWVESKQRQRRKAKIQNRTMFSL